VRWPSRSQRPRLASGHLRLLGRTLAAPIFLGYLLRKRFLLRPYAALGSMIAGIAGCATAQLIGTTVP